MIMRLFLNLQLLSQKHNSFEAEEGVMMTWQCASSFMHG
jgi:hypothetical protein